MRRFLADTFAMITLSTVCGMVIEIFVSGMTLGQSAQARLAAVPVNLLTARPYGMFRDWLFQMTKADIGGEVRKILVDTLAFIVFQVPLYATILWFSGANTRQIAAACGSVTIVSAFIGRPYGMLLELFRWLFGVKKESRS
jgi:hypothetical protein